MGLRGREGSAAGLSQERAVLQFGFWEAAGEKMLPPGPRRQHLPTAGAQGRGGIAGALAHPSYHTAAAADIPILRDYVMLREETPARCWQHQGKAGLNTYFCSCKSGNSSSLFEQKFGAQKLHRVGRGSWVEGTSPNWAARDSAVIMAGKFIFVLRMSGLIHQISMHCLHLGVRVQLTAG